MDNNRKIAVVGLWHLGCSVSAALASKGFEVIGIDFDEKLINRLNRGILPLSEPGLTDLTNEQIKKGRLSFSTIFRVIRKCDYIIIAYDTPVDNKDRPDLSIVKKAFSKIQKYLKKGSLLVVMSQVPVGTSRNFYTALEKNRKQVEVVYNPENVRLGNAINTFLEADRQIIGLSSPKAKSLILKFYSFYKNPLLFMSLESAELVKHGINSFLATSVSFINQISDLSEKVGANIKEVVLGLKSDSRIGPKAFLSPGLGFAGGTLGRDLQVLREMSKKYKLSLPLFREVYEINKNRKFSLFAKLRKVYPKLKAKKIAFFGLVYKPGTNTLRRSLALEIAKDMVKEGANITAFDPALKRSEKKLPGISLARNPFAAALGADALVLITEWPEFAKLDYRKIGKLMKSKLIFDTKNILDKEQMLKLKFNYHGTGL